MLDILQILLAISIIPTAAFVFWRLTHFLATSAAAIPALKPNKAIPRLFHPPAQASLALLFCLKLPSIPQAACKQNITSIQTVLRHLAFSV